LTLEKRLGAAEVFDAPEGVSWAFWGASAEMDWSGGNLSASVASKSLVLERRVERFCGKETRRAVANGGGSGDYGGKR